MLDRYRWFLSSGDAYALRCAYVHEGRGEILEQRAREALTHISFHVPNKPGIVAHNFHLSPGGHKEEKVLFPSVSITPYRVSSWLFRSRRLRRCCCRRRTPNYS